MIMDEEGEEEGVMDRLRASNFQGESVLEVVHASLFMVAESHKGVVFGSKIPFLKGMIQERNLAEKNIGENKQERDAIGVVWEERITLKDLVMKIWELDKESM